jgi:hypothetical protein
MRVTAPASDLRVMSGNAMSGGVTSFSVPTRCTFPT